MISLYMLQRLSAFLMIPFVIVHIVLMIYAIEGGLSADEVLGRTRGSIFWFFYYSIFVFLVSLHGSLGLRIVLSELLDFTSRALTSLTIFVFLFLLLLGFFSVYAVTATG